MKTAAIIFTPMNLKYFGDKYNVNWDYLGDPVYQHYPLRYSPTRDRVRVLYIEEIHVAVDKPKTILI